MQQAVVGADEQAVVERGAQRDGAPPRADLRVDDREVHAGRGVGEGAREHQRAGEDGLARDAVREVDHARGRALVRDHGVHDADELVRQPVVGEEGDRPRHLPTFSRRPVPRPPVRRGCGGRPRGRARARGRAARRWSRGRSRRASGRRGQLAGRGQQVADGRGGGERDVVGARRRPRSRRRRAARARSRRARATSTCAPRSRSASGRTSRPSLPRAMSDALHGDVGERLDHPLGHRALRHDVRRDPVLLERARGAGPHRRDAARRRGSRASREVAEQLAHAVRARRDQQVVAGRVRHLRGQRLRADRGRLDHVGAELAQPRGERARLRPRPRDGDRPPVQRPPLEPGEVVAQRGHRPDERHRGRADALGLRPLGDVGERGEHRALAGERPALDDRHRLVRRPPLGLQPLGDPRQRAHAHVEDERAGEARERRPVERRLRLVGVLVAGDERDAAGEVAVGDGDAGVRGRGDAGGDPGHDLEVDPGLAQPQRLLAAAAEHERVAALQPHDPLAGARRARRAAGRSPPAASAARRPACRRTRAPPRAARGAARPAGSGGRRGRRRPSRAARRRGA